LASCEFGLRGVNSNKTEADDDIKTHEVANLREVNSNKTAEADDDIKTRKVANQSGKVNLNRSKHQPTSIQDQKPACHVIRNSDN
jgi:hypothetical protein